MQYNNWKEWYKNQPPRQIKWTKNVGKMVNRLEKKHDVDLTDIMEHLDANYFLIPTKRKYKDGREQLINVLNVPLLEMHIDYILEHPDHEDRIEGIVWNSEETIKEIQARHGILKIEEKDKPSYEQVMNPNHNGDVSADFGYRKYLEELKKLEANINLNNNHLNN